MTVHVYIWDASDKGSFGHVSIGLSNRTYMSWWPKEEASLLKKNVPGEPITDLVEDIKMEGGKAPKTYALVDLNENSMERYWEHFQSEDDPEWKLLSLNCATVAHNVLCEGHDFFNRYKRVVWTPSELEKIVKKYMEECMDGAACGKKKVKKVGIF